MRRSSGRYLTAPFKARHWRSLRNIPVTVRRPVGFVNRYVTGRGSYPAQVSVRTPIGPLCLTVYSSDDVATVNEVFCRLDYRVPHDISTVLDIGANIGISAAYFLSRNEQVRAICYEPAPGNLPRLRAQLEPYAGRFEVHPSAVATEDGHVDFGVESTGRYGSMYVTPAHERITVPCESINNVLRRALESFERIDVLKVDTEGLEPATIQAIEPELVARIGTILFEALEPMPFHPTAFESNFDGAVNRLTARTAAS